MFWQNRGRAARFMRKWHEGGDAASAELYSSMKPASAAAAAAAEVDAGDTAPVGLKRNKNKRVRAEGGKEKRPETTLEESGAAEAVLQKWRDIPR